MRYCKVLFNMNILVSISYNISLCLSTWCMVKFRYLASCFICLSCNWFCFWRICKLSLILEILLALENIPHPKSQVNIPVLFILDKLLCRLGFTWYRPFKKVSKNFLQKESTLLLVNGNLHITYRGHSFLLWLYSYDVVVKDGSQYGQVILGISYILHGILVNVLYL